MNWRILPVLLALLASSQARADINSALPSPAAQLCRQAISAAERAHGIPAHLLAAIARVESGRRDQPTGSLNPWPWTINMDGQGSFYDDKGQAVAAARAMRPRVVRSIDVGCMQISLVHHPDAFTGLEQAFDQMANADYGARFLVQLFEKTGSWARAVELYHSATPELGQEYRQRVYAAWPEEQRFAVTEEPPRRSWSNPFAPFTPSAGWRPRVGRVMQTTPNQGGTIAPGRTLEMYRSTPVRMASRGL